MKRRIEVPDHKYQPTKAELEEPIVLDRGGLSAGEAVERLARAVTAPAEVVEVSAKTWRKRRDPPVCLHPRPGLPLHDLKDWELYRIVPNGPEGRYRARRAALRRLRQAGSQRPRRVSSRIPK